MVLTGYLDDGAQGAQAIHLAIGRGFSAPHGTPSAVINSYLLPLIRRKRRTVDDQQYLHAHCEALRQRSARLQAKAKAMRHGFGRFRPEAAPWRHTPSLSGGRIYTVPINLHDDAMALLRQMRTQLDTLPLEWQVAVIKALTVRTILKARDQTPPRQVLSA